MLPTPVKYCIIDLSLCSLTPSWHNKIQDVEISSTIKPFLFLFLWEGAMSLCCSLSHTDTQVCCCIQPKDSFRHSLTQIRWLFSSARGLASARTSSFNEKEPLKSMASRVPTYTRGTGEEVRTVAASTDCGWLAVGMHQPSGHQCDRQDRLPSH